MKRSKALPYLLGLSVMLSMSACVDDWGQEDPIPGTDKYYAANASLGSYDFEEGLGDGIESTSYSNGVNTLSPVVQDAPLEDGESDYYGQVLNLQGGTVTIDNPFEDNTGSVANVTFYLKQTPLFHYSTTLTEEGEEGYSVDSVFKSTTSLLKWNGAAGQNVAINADGALSYEALGSTQTFASDGRSNGLTADYLWHYWAIEITNKGYDIYVDGYHRISQASSEFDFSQVTDFLNGAPTLVIGDDAVANVYVDQLTFSTTTLTNDKKKDPRVKEETGEEAIDPYIYVGTEDCTSAFFGPKSDFFELADGQTFHTKFTNYTNGANNWENWVLCLSTCENGGTGYAEYFVIRADAYGWGDGNYDASTISSDYDWTTFLQEMNGAVVDLTVTRTGNTVDVAAVTTTSTNTVRNYTFSYTGDLSKGCGLFLTLEKAYLVLESAETYISSNGNSNVGNEDYTQNTWWTVFSDTYTYTGNFDVTFMFVNHQSGAGSNWNNWLLVCTDGADSHGGGGNEYFVLRSDAYGWGTLYANGVMTQNYDFDSYVKDLHDATCYVNVVRNANNVTMTAYIYTTAGKWLAPYTFSVDGITSTECGIFLTAELAYLEMQAVGTFPYWENIPGYWGATK